MITFDEKKEFDVCAMGRSSVDIYPNEFGSLENVSSFNKYLGGSPANTAVGLSKLGLKVGFIGKVSADDFGNFVKDSLSRNKVDTSHVETDKMGARTALSFCRLKKGEAATGFMYRQKCADLNITCSQIDKEYIARHKVLLISGTSLSHSPAREAVFYAIRLAKEKNVRVVLDLDYREGTWDNLDEASTYYTLAAQDSDIVFGTREEYDVLEYLHMSSRKKHTDQAISQSLFIGRPSMVCIKKGTQGSIVFTREGDAYKGGIYEVESCNTFGAGDSYSSAFIYCILKAKGVGQALRYAAASAAYTVMRPSCSDAMPSLEDIKTIYKQKTYKET